MIASKKYIKLHKVMDFYDVVSISGSWNKNGEKKKLNVCTIARFSR